MFRSRLYPFELTPIGTIWASDSSPQAPTSGGYPDGERDYTLELDAVYFDGCIGLETVSQLTILYWLRKADRTVLKSNPPDGSTELGVFAMRVPDRPNPIGMGTVLIQRVEKNIIHVRGQLACPTGTILLDLRPHAGGEIDNCYAMI